MTRHCGKCTLCCEVIEVAPLKKPAHQRCVFQGTRGCTIHNDPPECCKAFSCMWLKGLLPKHMRPDKVGAVFWPTQIIGMDGHHFTILAVTMRKGTRPNVDVMAAAKHMSTRLPVSVDVDAVCTIYQDGEPLVTWKRDSEFFSFDLEEGRMVNATIKKREDVFAQPGMAEKWERAERSAVIVQETGRFKHEH